MDAASTADVARVGRLVHRGGRLHLEGLAFDPAEPVAGLDLERFDAFSPDARLVVHGENGDEEWPIPATAYFRGRVIGEPDSLAVLAIHENGAVRGLVRRAGGLWDLTPQLSETGHELLAARPAEAAGGTERPFECGIDRLPTLPADLEEALPPRGAPKGGTSTLYTALVAIETDWEYFNKFGNVSAASEYLGDIFAYLSAVFDREVGTDLQISHLSLWTTPEDPWEQTEGDCTMFEVGRFWNHHRAEVERTVLHFVSGKTSIAGIAWVGGLCRGTGEIDLGADRCPGLTPRKDLYFAGVGVSGSINRNFDPRRPTIPAWDIQVIGHELGHNFGSLHTHCYVGVGGSSEPVDRCFSTQGIPRCFEGPVKLPGPPGAGSGTLLSYCHTLHPGLGNVALTFGAGHPYGVLPQRVPDAMREYVESLAASEPACLERRAPRLTTAELPGYAFRVWIDPGGGEQKIAGQRDAGCPGETLCVSGALPGRSELFVRIIGPRPNGKLWVNLVRFTPSRIELEVEQLATGEVNRYELPAVPRGSTDLSGLVDKEAFMPPPAGAVPVRRAVRERALGADGVVALRPGGDPADVGATSIAPRGATFTHPEFPGFRFTVGIDAGGDEAPVQVEPDCLPETVCTSGALSGRSELFLRIIGPRPNGKLWVNLVRFTTSQVEVEIEQIATGAKRSYVLPAIPRQSDELSGLLDAAAFDP